MGNRRTWAVLAAIVGVNVIFGVYHTINFAALSYEVVPEKYPLNSPGLCSNGTVDLLVLVLSSPVNDLPRNTIRRTWGSLGKSNGSIRIGFLLGSPKNKDIQKKLEKEALEYGDIIQSNFTDSYYNLTLKSMMLLEWTLQYCDKARWVLKTDDDMFINIPVLQKSLADAHNATPTIYGYLFHAAIPIRNAKSKWFVPKSIYSERLYPDYQSGTGYVIPVSVIDHLLETCRQLPFMSMEDVFITGLCAQKAGIPRKHMEGFSYMRRTPNACAFRDVISGHSVKPKEMSFIWLDLQKNITKCKRK